MKKVNSPLSDDNFFWFEFLPGRYIRYSRSRIVETVKGLPSREFMKEFIEGLELNRLAEAEGDDWVPVVKELFDKYVDSFMLALCGQLCTNPALGG